MKHSVVKKYAITTAVSLVIAVLVEGLLAVVAAIWAPYLLSVAIGLTLVLAVLIGFFVYKGFSNLMQGRINDIHAPLQQAIQGNHMIRLAEGEDEFAPLERSFNELMKQMTSMSSKQVDSEQLVDWAKREIQLKDQIMQKSRDLEESNLVLKKRLHERELMLKIVEAINSTLSLDEVLREITNIVGSELGMQEFVVLLKEPGSGALKIAAVYGVNDANRVLNLEFKPGEGIVGQVMDTGETVYVSDVRQEPRFMHYKGRRQVMGSFLAIPIKVRGEVQGVLGFIRPKVNGFTPGEIDFLKILAHQVNFAIQNAYSFEQVRRQAEYDALTDLLGRRSGMERLQQEFLDSVNRNKPFCLIMLDIDDFKKHNDTYGHLVGDEVLKKVAHFIKVNIRKVDIACRYGGEEFLIGLHRTDLRDGLVVAEKIRSTVNAHDFYVNQEKKMRLSVSEGAASVDKTCKTFTELIDRSDQAMLAAKRAGKDVVYAFTDKGFQPASKLVQM